MKRDLLELFGLDFSEILRIAANSSWGKAKRTQIEGSFHLDFPKGGIAFFGDDSKSVSTVFLYSEGYEGFKQYIGQLPHELSFKIGRKQVRHSLGKSTDTGDGEEDSILGRIPPYDRFEKEGLSFYVGYSDDLASILIIKITRI